MIFPLLLILKMECHDPRQSIERSKDWKRNKIGFSTIHARQIYFLEHFFSSFIDRSISVSVSWWQKMLLLFSHLFFLFRILIAFLTMARRENDPFKNVNARGLSAKKPDLSYDFVEHKNYDSWLRDICRFKTQQIECMTPLYSEILISWTLDKWIRR